MSKTSVIRCPHCEAAFKVKSKVPVGKKIACPKCREPFVVSGANSSSPPRKKRKPAPVSHEWDDDDLMEEPPVRQASSGGRSRRPGQKSGKKQSAGTMFIVAGVLGVALIVGGGILFLSSGSSSSEQQTDTPALADSDVSEPETEAVAEVVSEESVEPQKMESSTAPASPATALDSGTKLTFKIVAIHENVGKILHNTKNSDEENRIQQAEDVAERSLASTLGDKFLNQISFLDVDLKKQELSFSMREPIPGNLIQAINSVSYQMVSIAPLERTLYEELIEQYGKENLIAHELEFWIHKIDPEIQKQLELNFEAGSQTLYQTLNEQFKQSLPEYISDSLKLDLEYKILTIQVIQPPAHNLGAQINALPMNPVTIGITPDREIEVRTESQKQHVQVTYQIVDDYGVTIKDGKENRTYNFDRGLTIRELSEVLHEKVLGFIPGTLDVSFPKKTVTFQMDHRPDDELGTRISAMMSFKKLGLAAKPLSIGPPAPPFRTAGRPMYFVVLKVLTVKDSFSELHRDQHPEQIKKYLADRFWIFKDDVERALDGAIIASAKVDPQRMYLGVQIDRIPPDDLAKQINHASSFPLVLADEIVSVNKVEYDPESSEKTMYFQFINNGQKLPQFNHRHIKQVTNGNLTGVERYIPDSLNIDFEKGLFDIKVRVGGNEQDEIERAVKLLKGIQLEVTHLKTVPPQGTSKIDPTGIGIVSADAVVSSAGTNSPMNPGTGAPLSPGQNLKITIQFGLFAGKGKIEANALDVLDGFSWIDQKSITVDASGKEITFHTTGPMNEAALERLLKRQKFYQCLIKKEPLPAETTKQ